MYLTAQHNAQYTVYSIQCTVYSVQYTVYSGVECPGGNEDINPHHIFILEKKGRRETMKKISEGNITELPLYCTRS